MCDRGFGGRMATLADLIAGLSTTPPASDSATAPDGLVIVTGMDARLDPLGLFGLSPGGAQVVRNAGAMVSEDVLRSLVLAEQMSGARRVAVVGVKGSFVEGVKAARMRDMMTEKTQHVVQSPMFLYGYDEVVASVQRQVQRVQGHPWLSLEEVAGFVWDPETGTLELVAPPA